MEKKPSYEELQQRVKELESSELVLKQVESDLFKEQEKFKKFLDVADIIILAMNKDREVILINKKGCEILGYQSEEIIGRNWFDNFLPERMRAGVIEVFNKMVAGEVEPVEHFENPVLTRSGEERIIAWHNAVFYDDNGEFMHSVVSGEDITEKRVVEEELHLQSEIINRLTVGVYLVRMDGTIIYTNPRFEEMFGYSPGEMLGRHVSVVNYPTDKSPDETSCEILAVLDKKGSWQGEIKNIRKDGTAFWSYARVGTFNHVNHGRVLVAVHDDITERKKAEEKLNILSVAISEAMDGFQIVDLEGRIIYSNKAVELIFGYTQEELHGQYVKIMNADPYFADEVILPHIKQFGRWEGELICKKKDGSEFPNWLCASLIRDKSGKAVAMVGCIRDISEIKKAEGKLQAAHDKLEERVGKRTAKLKEAYLKLQKEAAERKLAVEEAAVMGERSRLARELHDSVTQSLYSLTLFAETGIQHIKSEDYASLEECLQELNTNAQATLKEMRLLLYDLMPKEFERDGLLKALQKRLETVELRAGVKSELVVQGNDLLSFDLENALYRIAQEALNNSLKHSGALNVRIVLKIEPEVVEMEVADNGIGFNSDQNKSLGGFGLRNIRERVEKLGGKVEIISSPTSGTKIHVSIKK